MLDSRSMVPSGRHHLPETLAQLALVVAALFTGAAVDVNAVEHPARRHLDPRAALQEWQPAYKRGAAMQATLALVGFVLAATAAWLGAGTFVALGAALIIAPWPWTYSPSCRSTSDSWR